MNEIIVDKKGELFLGLMAPSCLFPCSREAPRVQREASDRCLMAAISA